MQLYVRALGSSFLLNGNDDDDDDDDDDGDGDAVVIWWLQAVKTTHSTSITKDSQNIYLLSSLTLFAPSWYRLVLINC